MLGRTRQFQQNSCRLGRRNMRQKPRNAHDPPLWAHSDRGTIAALFFRRFDSKIHCSPAPRRGV